ncbi:MAG: family 43 glycosylhydrolase [Opitutales bacterium]|nr:family 43 glycosylhydrolase [Opitutales bacterium]
MVHSSFESIPGLLIWHSKDLVNWEPVTSALNTYVGSVWAPDLSYLDDRYYIYFPAVSEKGFTNMVVYADDIKGPWHGPVDLEVGNFDPGHLVDKNGQRYLYFNGGNMGKLRADGLSMEGKVHHVYDGWKYPEHWEVETFAQEGPKMLKHGAYYYMVLAEGGTAGPATSHMVIMARSTSPEGPWENSPYNPVVHTGSSQEKWWSRGHATLLEGPDKQWYLVYHAYEKDFYTLGRQTLLEPVEWTADGWVKASGYDVARPIPLPEGGIAVAHGQALSDDFSRNKIGLQWKFFQPRSNYTERYRYEDGSLVLEAEGNSPKDSSPLLFITGDQAYEMQVEVDCDENAKGGLLLFYNHNLFAGHGFSNNKMLEYCKGGVQEFPKPDYIGNRFFLKIRNNRNVVTVWYSADGENWTKHWMQYEVSGYHHNIEGGFLTLAPALMAAGEGEVRFRDFKYKALP